MWNRDNLDDHVSDPSVQAYHPDHHRATGPLRGVKADVYDGGNRVPFLVRWPGHVAEGSQNDQPLCLTDVYATLAELARIDLDQSEAEDSFSFLSILKGESDSIDRAPVIHQAASRMKAIRDGRWKLILGNGSGGRTRPRGSAFERPYQLYDLEEDLSEEQNLIETHPDIAERLEARFEAIREAGRSVDR
jgi:arylsulfatase A-like enzyme